MKKIIAYMTMSSLILASCGTNTEVNKVEKEYKNISSTIIKKWVFNEELKLIWKVSPVMETSISSLAWWEIKSINAEVWQKVKTWEILAMIDLESSAYKTSLENASNTYANTLNSYEATLVSIESDLNSAKLQLENAKTARDNTYQTTEKQLELTEKQLENIKTTKKNTIITTWESQKNAELQLENAQTSLDNFEKNSAETQKGLADKKKWLIDSIKVAIDNTSVTLDNALNQADLLLWISETNKYNNDSFENNLWTKNSQTKTDSENLYRKNFSEFEQAETERKTMDETQIVTFLQKYVKLSEWINELYSKMSDMLDNSITSTSFTQTQLDAYKTIVTTKQWLILASKSSLVGLNNSLTDLDNTISSTNTNIENQRISLNNAINIAKTWLDNLKAWNTTQLDTLSWNESLTESQLENTQATIKSTRDTTDNAVIIAESNYNSVKAKLEASRNQTKTALDSSKWWKELAKIQLDNTKISAPFDWIILSRNIEKWSLVNIWTPTFTIWSETWKKVKLELNSDNIKDVSIWQEAIIKSWEKTYTWIISLISPQADATSRLFKTEVSFLKEPKDIKLWDFVDVFISIVKWKDNVIQVPFSSIISQWQWEYSVFIVNWEKAKLRKVKLWDQNSTAVEIIEWLSEWDRLISKWTLNISDWDYVKENK